VPRDLSFLQLTTFLGTEEGFSDVVVPDFYSPSDSVNVYVDKTGRIARILGTSAKSADLVTDTGSTAAKVLSLVPVNDSNGKTNTVFAYLSDGVNEAELWKGTLAGSFADFAFSKETSTSAVTLPADWTAFGDNTYITCAPGTPQKWDGSSLTNAGLTQSPTVTSVAGSATTHAGTYRWKLVSMVGPTRQQGSVASTALALNDEDADLTWTADTDGTVTGYELYRTTGTGEIFYFTDYIDGRLTASYTDIIPDSVILGNRALQEQGDAPPSSQFVETHKERTWWANTATNPNRLWWSDPARPESIGALNFIDLHDPETRSPAITAVVGDFEGRLTVWSRGSIWSVSGTMTVLANGVLDLYVTKTAASVGATSRRSIVRVPRGAVYRDTFGRLQRTDKPELGYLSSHGDIRLFGGESDVIISGAIQPTPFASNPPDPSDNASYATHDESRSLIWWSIPTTEAVANSVQTIVWDYKHGTWYRWTGIQSQCSLVAKTSTEGTSLILGAEPARLSAAAGVKILQLFTGNTDVDSAAIAGRWVTRTLYPAAEDANALDLHTTKRFRWVDMALGANVGAIFLKVWPAHADADSGDTPLFTSTIAAATLVDADQGVVQLKTLLKSSTGRYTHATGIRLEVGNTASGAPWNLQGITLAYQAMPGLRRRSG